MRVGYVHIMGRTRNEIIQRYQQAYQLGNGKPPPRPRFQCIK